MDEIIEHEWKKDDEIVSHRIQPQNVHSDGNFQWLSMDKFVRR